MYIVKEESTAPTVSTEVVFLTAVIDAWENRNVTVLDVPGAFVEKPQFPIVFNFSCALFKSRTTCLNVSFTTYEYFYKLSRSASFSRWLLPPVTQKNQ